MHYNQGEGEYDSEDGANNRFSATLASDLPAGIADADEPLFNGKQCTVTVANMAQPLNPGDDSKITIAGGTGDNLSSGGTTFNGTIEAAIVKELEVETSVKDATLTLNGVTVADNSSGNAGTTTIKGGADLTLRIEGTNDLGTLTIEQGATIVLDKTGEASLGNTTIKNAGTFIDTTATIRKVEGDVSLDIKGDLEGGGTVEAGKPITLTASTNEGEGTITFTWQKKAANGSFINIDGATKIYTDGELQTKTVRGIDDQYKVSSATAGDAAEYRCLIERTVVSSGTSGQTKATTLLSTQPAKVVVKSGDVPPPLPPLPPSPPDEPTGIDSVEADGICVWSSPGMLHISTEKATSAAIYTLAGYPVIKQELPAGDTRIELSRGIYIVTTGNQHRKLIIR